MFIKNLECNDLYKSYITLLSQLSYCTTSIKKKEWNDFFQDLQNNKHHFIFVIEDHEKKQIIASITLLIENKVLRNFGKVGHIEDLVVDKNYRKLGLAQKLIEYCISISKTKYHCYKVILNCDESLKEFYKKFSFKQKNIEMSLYLM
jgi:glucosamine-phosphate N-acetyltransferase